MLLIVFLLSAFMMLVSLVLEPTRGMTFVAWTVSALLGFSLMLVTSP
jgi:hypothetical protein